MKVLSFIRQRSFARYVAFDLAEAARRLQWAVQWVGIDGILQEGHERDDGRNVVFYGLEAFAWPFTDWWSDDDWTVATAARAPIACFLFDFGYPFDGTGGDQATALLARLGDPDVQLWCWDEFVEALAASRPLRRPERWRRASREAAGTDP